MRRIRSLLLTIGLLALWCGGLRYGWTRPGDTFALQLLVVCAIPVMWLLLGGPIWLWHWLTRR